MADINIVQYNNNKLFEDSTGKALSANNLNRIENAVRDILGVYVEQDDKDAGGARDTTGYLQKILDEVNVKATQDEVDALETAVADRYTKEDADERFVNSSLTYDFCGGSATALHKPELE